MAWLLLEGTASPLAIGLLVFVRYSSFLLAGPLVGAIADRFPRIRILQFVQGGIGAGALLVAAMLALDWMSLWLIYLYTFIHGVLFLFELPARRTYMSAVVGPRLMTPAMALDVMSLTAAWFLGSNVGGAVLSAVKPQYIYVGLAAMALSNLVILRDLPVLFRSRSNVNRESFFRSMVEGVRFARRSRTVLGLLVVIAFMSLTGFTFEVLTALMAKEVFQAGPLVFGLIVSAQGFGSFIAALGITVSSRRIARPGRFVISAAMIAYGLGFAFSLAGSAPVAFLMLLILGTLTMSFNILTNSMLLAATPADFRGRIMGLQMLVVGLFPVSALWSGALAMWVGPALTLQVTAVMGFGMMALAAFAFPEVRWFVMPSTRGRQAPPTVGPQVPDPSLDPVPAAT